MVNPPTGGETINGNERIGWNQPAADAVELATIRYAIYVDGTRTDAAGVTCATSATAAGFACTARLPPLTPGAHSLQLASFVDDGGVLESARSAALPVTVVATTVDRSAEASARSDRAPSAGTDRSARASAERLVILEGISDPTDLAVAPDGRLFVAERTGAVRVVAANRVEAVRLRSSATPTSGAQARDGDAGRSSLHLPDRAELLAVAVDPQFVTSRLVFAIYAEPGGDAGATFTLARFRDAAGTLADAVVLLDRIPASPSPHAVLRFGADGNLYAAFDTGFDVRRSDDLAFFNGKVLRLQTDGTTPRDQPSSTPVVSSGLFAPAGLAWEAGSRDPWVVDRRADRSAQLIEVGGGRRAYRLPDGITPSSVIGTRDGDLLIGSADTGVLLRVRFDNAQPISTERIALTDIDAVRALTLAPDRTLYLATPTRVWALAGEW